MFVIVYYISILIIIFILYIVCIYCVSKDPAGTIQ